MNKWKSWRIYAPPVAVLVVTYLTAWIVPSLKDQISTPGIITAGFTLLEQLWREQIELDRRMALQANQQDFTVGVASDMAKVAYTKHLEFAEAYSQQVLAGLSQTTKPGPLADTTLLDLAGDLLRIRETSVVWLPEELQNKLLQFELALREVGANSYVRQHTPPQPGMSVQESVQPIMHAFQLVTGRAEPGSEEERAKSLRGAMEALRTPLGIGELTALRDAALHAAKTRLERAARGTDGP